MDDLEKKTCATIDVVATDLNPALNGGIYTLAKSSSASSVSRQDIAYENLVISWESVQVVGNERRLDEEQEEKHTVNAQVTLYGTTGVVQIYWGNRDVKGSNVRSGISDLLSCPRTPVQLLWVFR